MPKHIWAGANGSRASSKQQRLLCNMFDWNYNASLDLKHHPYTQNVKRNNWLCSMRLTLTHKSAVPHSDRITMEHLDKTKNMNAGQHYCSLAFSGQIHFTISAKIPPKQNAHTCCDGSAIGFSVSGGRLSQHRLQTFFSRLTSSHFAAGFSMTGRIFASEFLHQV